jgi:hypothetical protein
MQPFYIAKLGMAYQQDLRRRFQNMVIKQKLNSHCRKNGTAKQHILIKLFHVV